MRPRYFKSPAAWRAWLAANHAKATELWVGFHKRATGKPSITWPESVDGALCFGWIDGLRRSLGDEAYMIRFTPRKASSNWSNVNVRRVRELERLGLMRPAGQRAFEARSASRTGVYAFEKRPQVLSPAFLRRLKANAKARAFFDSQPPWYRRTCAHWVMSAKREETRERRLAALISDSAAGRRIGPIRQMSGEK